MLKMQWRRSRLALAFLTTAWMGVAVTPLTAGTVNRNQTMQVTVSGPGDSGSNDHICIGQTYFWIGTASIFTIERDWEFDGTWQNDGSTIMGHAFNTGGWHSVTFEASYNGDRDTMRLWVFAESC